MLPNLKFQMTICQKNILTKLKQIPETDLQLVQKLNWQAKCYNKKQTSIQKKAQTPRDQDGFYK